MSYFCPQNLKIERECAAAAIALAVFCSPTHAHDWYDSACCSEKDCRPVKAGEVKIDHGQLMLRNTDIAECDFMALDNARWRQKLSMDAESHVCFQLSINPCRPVCFYFAGAS